MTESESRKPELRKLAPTGILGVLWALFPAICGITLIIYIGAVSDWIIEQQTMGLILYVGIFVVSAGFGLLPTYAQAVLGGWVFGFVVGFPAALVGFAGGAVIGYFITKLVARHNVEDVIKENEKARVIHNALVGHGFWRTLGIVALLRMPPSSPFALTNLVMASSGVKLLPFSIGTLLGMAPRTGVAVFLAAAAKATGAKDLQSFAEDKGIGLIVAGIVTMIIALAIIGVIAKKALAKITPDTNPDELDEKAASETESDK